MTAYLTQALNFKLSRYKQWIIFSFYNMLHVLLEVYTIMINIKGFNIRKYKTIVNKSLSILKDNIL